MTCKLVRTMKMLVSSLVVTAIVMAGNIISPIDVKAADATGNVQYLAYGEEFNYASYLDNDKAPAYTGDDTTGFGYLFGGWYIKDGNSYTPIATKDDLPSNKAAVVAKFVPAQVLSVKCQNWAGTQEGSDNVRIRVISAVDSTNYSEYGFGISKIVNGEEIELGTAVKKDTYSTFNYYKTSTDTEPADSFVPSDLFGTAAERFISCVVGYIPSGSHGEIICIKPYWKTLDGTTVYGLSKFAHVEDGYLGYVNVPVNLNILSESNKAAAGFLTVKCESEGLTFLGLEKVVEYGKVFEEMAVNVTDDGTIKCVGNTSDATDKTENDIFINLKFSRDNFDASNPSPDTTFYEFTVGSEDFANRDEETTTADVWNIRY